MQALTTSGSPSTSGTMNSMQSGSNQASTSSTSASSLTSAVAAAAAAAVSAQQNSSSNASMPTAADFGLMLSLGLGLNPNDASQLANWDLQKLAMYLVSVFFFYFELLYGGRIRF